MKFKTQTGSVYQVDLKNKKFRRVIGVTKATARVGDDGGWKTYKEIIGPKIGCECLFAYDKNTTPSLVGTLKHLDAAPVTLTSKVVEIIEDEKIFN